MKSENRLLRGATAVAVAAMAAGAAAAAADEPRSLRGPVDTFRVQIFHTSDQEGGLDAIDNAANYAAIVDRLEDEAGFDATLNVTAGDQYIPSPFFNAAGNGDLRGVFQDVYQTIYNEPGLTNIREGSGRADAAINTIIGVDVSAIGNHEFDAGTRAYRDINSPDIRGPQLGDVRWLGVPYAYVSANLDFSGDSNLSGSRSTTDILPVGDYGPNLVDLAQTTNLTSGPAVTISEGGQTFGVVGATTPLLASITSVGGVTVQEPGAGTEDMAALASILQPRIDELTSAGVDKIILTSHLQQFALEQELATLLSGVDVIIAGGSDTILAQPDDVLRPGDTADEVYPFVTSNADDEPVVIVSTNNEYSYVGRLIVEFDDQGVLVPGSWNDPAGGIYASLDEVVEGIYGTDDPFETGSRGELVSRLTTAVGGVVIATDGIVYGETDVFLEGRRENVRTQETNLGNLTADANLAEAKKVDATVLVSHKNGGGIRSEIGTFDQDGNPLPPPANPLSGKLAGQVSQLDIENSLRFNNGLSLLTLTAAELDSVIEHAVAGSGDGATPGQFGQFGGVRFSFDTTRTAQQLNADGTVLVAGERVRNAVLTDGDGEVVDILVLDGMLYGDPDRLIRIVTLDFLAGGGDSYPFAGITDREPTRVNRVDLGDLNLPPGDATATDPGGEQDALAEFLIAQFGIDAGTPFADPETPPELDERIQNLGFRADAVLDGVVLDDDSMRFGRGTAVGTAGDDIVVGGLGRDTLTGNEGSDVFAYGSIRDAGDVITDFEVGSDVIDLTVLLRGLGYAGSDPLGDGLVTTRGFVVGTLVFLTMDNRRSTPLAILQGVLPGDVTASSFVVR